MIRTKMTTVFFGEKNRSAVNPTLDERSTLAVKLYVPLFTSPHWCDELSLWRKTYCSLISKSIEIDFWSLIER